jgi:predicted N-formylglutamate amidohydrolase
MSNVDESALGKPGHDLSHAVEDHQLQNDAPLLADDEPEPFEILNTELEAKLLVVCDHASNRIPRSLNNLGLDEYSMRRHIAWDIGAGEVSRFLSLSLNVPAVLANYSRLVVDCNRRLDDATAFRALSDGDEIPGNHLLTVGEKARRADAIYWPYHQVIADRIDHVCRPDFAPAMLSIHSFTPFFDNEHRPWEIGILWDTDPRIAVPLMASLKEKGVIVGNNEPYSGRHPHDFTVHYHGEKRGLPHVSIEIRQNLLRDTGSRRRWAATLADCIRPILQDGDLYRYNQDQHVAGESEK